MVKEVTGGHAVTYHPVEDDPDKVFEVDFSPPFRRVRCVQYNILLLVDHPTMKVSALLHSLPLFLSLFTASLLLIFVS